VISAPVLPPAMVKGLAFAVSSLNILAPVSLDTVRFKVATVSNPCFQT